MKDDVSILDGRKFEESQQRRRFAMHLEYIAGNPLNAEQLAMFATFERECWSHEKRRAYIIDGERRRSIVG